MNTVVALIAAGDELSRTLDYRESLRNVAELASREVADWCTVHIVERDGSIAEIAVAHSDPAVVTFARPGVLPAPELPAA